MIAMYPSFVMDCPDAARLAQFYGEVLGWKVEARDDWADIKPEDGSNCISFQQVANFTAPAWPGQEKPQQMHLDVMVRDLDEAESEVLAIGATKAEHQPGTTFRVFLDPAGHPFCLCTS
ncbi:VOC family protein [Kribbella sp. NPDC000426]|uniref:VOC family protein n=1 Tax=Kribbella sp. NPDC000426 TaxID=3154255 RepID=UPI00331DFE4F